MTCRSRCGNWPGPHRLPRWRTACGSVSTGRSPTIASKRSWRRIPARRSSPIPQVPVMSTCPRSPEASTAPATPKTLSRSTRRTPMATSVPTTTSRWSTSSSRSSTRRARAARARPPTTRIWAGFGGDCQNTNDGDPIVQYDQFADRWMVSQFSVSGTSFHECVAVSQTPDPTGAYYRYQFDYADFPDYPKFGVWPDGYYVTYNMFNAAGTAFLGTKICALDRSAMLAGDAATQQCFDLPNEWSLLPSDADGPTPPPAGSPNYLLAEHWTDQDKLTMYKFAVNWATPANTTLTGPITIGGQPLHVGVLGRDPAALRPAEWHRRETRVAGRPTDVSVVLPQLRRPRVAGGQPHRRHGRPHRPDRPDRDRLVRAAQPHASHPDRPSAGHVRGPQRHDVPLDGIDGAGQAGQHGSGLQHLAAAPHSRGSATSDDSPAIR